MRTSLLVLLAPLAVAGEIEFEVDPASQVAVVVNDRVPESVRTGEYYCERRGVPGTMVVRVSTAPDEVIARPAFEKEILEPVAAFVKAHPAVLYVVTTYGVPLKIPETDAADDDSIEKGFVGGRDFAAVDQELACIPMGTWETKGIVNNPYFQKSEPISAALRRLVVGRLDGPTPEIARELVDRALLGERFGLEGKAYLDTRGITSNDGYGYRDGLNRRSAEVFAKYGLPCHHDDAPEVLDLSAFDDVVLYDGWYTGDYSFTKDPAFRFRPGAVAIHLHSFAASTVRSATANWVGPLVAHGAAASVGTVWEPLTLGFPVSPILFDRWLAGHTLGESVAMADACLSWQAILLGDPLYSPFSAGRAALQAGLRERRGRLEETWRSALAGGRAAEAWRAARELADLLAGLPLAVEAAASRARLESGALAELEPLLATFAREPSVEGGSALEAFASTWEGSDAARMASEAVSGAKRRADEDAEPLWQRGQKAEAAKDWAAAREVYQSLVRKHPLAGRAAESRSRLDAMAADPAIQAALGAAGRVEAARRLFTMGTNLRANGNEEGARRNFEKILAEYPDTEYAARAKKALGR